MPVLPFEVINGWDYSKNFLKTRAPVTRNRIGRKIEPTRPFRHPIMGWSAQDQKQIVARLLEKANKYCDFARWVNDRETILRILALTEELKQRARAMAAPNEDQIRKRAREIWEEYYRPVGRDDEFWHQAEQELQGSEVPLRKFLTILRHKS